MPTFSGNIVDVINQKIFPGTIEVCDGQITTITREERQFDHFIIPGFIDSHIHIESSMLPPAEFARAAVIHGTIAAVADPHEIANVLGTQGVDYMLSSGAQTPFKFYFGIPSCVPATDFETSGAKLDVNEIETLCHKPELKFLGEMMNYPGIIAGEKSVWEKINVARKYGKLIDGHAPSLTGDNLQKYFTAGISTDHECFTLAEAFEKIKLGMKVQIREGSAAKNFEVLVSLLEDYPHMCMFCSDDKHPDDLVNGHIESLVRRALRLGIDLMKVLHAATVTPIQHYGLDCGLLKVGDPADFLVIDSFRDLNILQTIINGEIVAENEQTYLPYQAPAPANHFNLQTKQPIEYCVPANGSEIQVIEVIPGQLETIRRVFPAKIRDGLVLSDPENDILKVTVVNRYQDTTPAIGFIKNIGLKKGAIASSVTHDSHNIIAVGVSDEEICAAVNLIIQYQGGICTVCNTEQMAEILPLPIAGLMSDRPFLEVAERYLEINQLAKGLGTTLDAPFMTLSFMALLVIPELKLSDRGLFDVTRFEFTKLNDKF